MSRRDRWLSNVELRGCEEIPCRIALSRAVWDQYRESLEELVRRHPSIFGEYRERKPWKEEYSPRHRRGEMWKDRWGCMWYNTYSGIAGQVVGHPLEDWGTFKDIKPPDPSKENDLEDLDWKKIAEDIRRAKEEGRVARGGVCHGFLFQRLYYLRGFENLMVDIAEKNENLPRLIDMILDYNMDLVRRYLELGVDVVHFGDDLGMQERLTISPDDWRRYIKPAYAKIFGMCREAGAQVHFHSDGYIVDIMPDLLEIGVTILNLQDLCNGLENIERELKGKICIDLDVDRQKIIPWGTPEEVDSHILNCIKTLGSPQGGLMLVCGIYPGTPFENIETVCEAMERYSRFWSAEGREIRWT